MPIDEELYFSHTRDRGLVEVFLRGHLWVESFLTGLVEAGLKHPEVMSLDRMRFAQKAALARALDVVDVEDYETLRLINRMRNKLAHDLAGEPTHDDIHRLEATLKPRHGGIYQSLLDREADEPDDDPYVRRLSFLFLVLIASMESHRQNHLYWTQYGEDIQAHDMLRRLEQAGNPDARTPITDRFMATRPPIPPRPTAADMWVTRSKAVGEPKD